MCWVPEGDQKWVEKKRELRITESGALSLVQHMDPPHIVTAVTPDEKVKVYVALRGMSSEVDMQTGEIKEWKEKTEIFQKKKKKQAD